MTSQENNASTSFFSSAKKGTMKGRGKRGKREEKSERARGKGKKRGKKGGEGEEKEKKMEEISLNGGEGFQEASWGVGNVFKKFEEYTPLLPLEAEVIKKIKKNNEGIFQPSKCEILYQ